MAKVKDSELAAEIVGYTRISVDTEIDRDSTSIENQVDIIRDFVETYFPKCKLTFYCDRDKSGYTFLERHDYQRMRSRLMSGEVKILVVKDFSRFSRRNSLGLYELELLRDAGARIISVTDGIDYPIRDDWTQIQLKFLLNEMPVTDTSKKVRAVIKRSQAKGEWLCAVPYGYAVTNYQKSLFQIVPDEAEVIREIFRLYGEGWGYKKIANYLTDKNVPTPRMKERERAEALGNDYRRKVRHEWSIATVSSILTNDFYQGTFRQHKYHRARINGKETRTQEEDQIVFEKHHDAIIDDRTFAFTKEQLKLRSTTNYRGVKKYETAYSGCLFCGDCGSPMFSMSRADIPPAYVCGLYHRRGLKGCTSHHTRVDFLDGVIKDYIKLVKDNCVEIMDQLERSIATESSAIKDNDNVIGLLESKLEAAKVELKATKKRKIKDVMKAPDDEELIEETYAEIESELSRQIYGLENQIRLVNDKRNTVIEANRSARTVFSVFDEILNQNKLTKFNIGSVVEKIAVYDTGMVEVKLKADVENLLKIGPASKEEVSSTFNDGSIDTSTLSSTYNLSVPKHKPKKYQINVVNEGDPSLITLESEAQIVEYIKQLSQRLEMQASYGLK